MKNHSKMIFLLFLGYVIVYIDKTVMGFALLPIEKEFALSTQQLGYITGIFFLAYSLFQIPAGWLNDRLGYKAMLVISLLPAGRLCLLIRRTGPEFWPAGHFSFSFRHGAFGLSLFVRQSGGE